MSLKAYLTLFFAFSVCKVTLVVCNVDEKGITGSFDISPATPPNVGKGEEEENVVLWWTPFTGIRGQSRTCSSGSCFFTENREHLRGRNTRAVLFYGSDFNVEDLPLPRMQGQWWALLHEESPKNQPLFDHELVLNLFNLTSTFRRESDFPLTLQHLASIRTLTSKDEYLSLAEKSLLASQDHLAPVIYVQSDCDTPSERDDYIEELSKYIKIDSYGSCLHNRDLPHYLQDPASNYDHPEFRELVAKYRFAIAIENAACEDYITEKLWRPLSVGTIPIYWGSPTISDWSPNPNSIINVRDFESPLRLAEHLHSIIHNYTLYESYLEHKIDRFIENEKLIQAMNDRKWGINNDFERGNFIEHFECHVCDQIISHSNAQKSGFRQPRKLQADLSHYGCPVPQSVLTGKPNPKSFWVEEWHKGRVEAEVLHKFVMSNSAYTSDQFFAEVIDKLQKDGFFHKFHKVHEEF